MHYLGFIDLANRFLRKFRKNDLELIQRYEKGVEAIEKTEKDIEILK